ncbi:unnamed protein product, partial [marine sediment metagenome]
APKSWLDEQLDKIGLDLRPAFEWLADRLEDLLEIPSKALFQFLEKILP